MRYLLGVDLGTSGTKTVLFDEQGSTVAAATVEYPLYQPKNGWAEQDPDDWYKAAVDTIRQVVTQSAVNPADIAGLAISGQMHGLVMLDAEGRVLRRSILWCDARTGAQCAEISEKVGKNRLIEINANPALPGFTACKILWVREHEHELYERCTTILLPKDYVRYKLTGLKAMEISDASGTNLLDIRKREWSGEILEKLAIDPGLLPPLIESSAVSGTITAEAAALTGLAAGTIVAGGAGDNAAAAIGTGVCRDGQSFVTLGTSGVVFAHTSKVSIDPLGRVHTFCAAVPGAWTAMSCTLAAGLSLRWMRDEFFAHEKDSEAKEGRDVYDLMTAAAAAEPVGSDGLIYLPYLMGERSPVLDPEARGVFFGLSARHTRAHLTRAVLEGITLSQRHNLEVLHQMGIVPSELAACGGGGRSPFWRQLLADILKCKVTTIASREGPALGAAILAGVAAGIFQSVEEGCDKLVVKGEAEALPQPGECARYDAVYGLYQSLYPALRGSFARLSTLRSRLEQSEAKAQFPSVFSTEFERYGRVISGVDTDKVAVLLEQCACPEDSVTYVPAEPILETEDLLADLQNRVFGGLPVEIGYCSGHNRVLNCLEYHRNSELNITGTDALFMLAPLTAVKDGIVDSQAVETFFAPKGTAILFYETTLHYAPCNTKDGKVFRVCVVLPRGTNTDKPTLTDDSLESAMLTAENKWLLAHRDSPEAKAGLSRGLVVGQNLCLDD